MKKNNLINKIGFMQGRLSIKEFNKIQSFPIKNWKNEFPIANLMNLKKMEWTIDYDYFYENPLMKKSCHKEIKSLKKKYKIQIDSVTCDFLMNKPFWKIKNNKKLLLDFENFLNNCVKISIKKIIVPLVDNGSINKDEQGVILKNILNKIIRKKKFQNLIFLFESNFEPKKIKLFFKNLNKKNYGINYDLGNSASLGHKIKQDFDTYSSLIKNIHLKDRKLKGQTVKFGKGSGEFVALFKYLKKINYKGNLILQSARSKDNNDIKEFHENIGFVKNLL